MRTIDADYVLSKIGEYAMHPNEELVNNLAIAFDIVVEAPTIDAVSVVRCKDCRHRYDDGWLEPRWTCDFLKDMRLKDDDFCSYGERKGE